MKLSEPCEVCGKPLESTSETPLNDTETLVVYRCGHCFVRTHVKALTTTSDIDFTSVNGDKIARPYQQDGVKFIIDSGFCCVLADQMRLGKTPQSLLALKNAIGEKTPTLILVRSANLYQWVNEFKTWTTSLPLGIWVIQGSKGWIPPGFSAYIMSMDTFSRKGMVEKLLAFGFKLVIADEAHSFKNVESNRSQALVRFLHDISESELKKTLTYHCVYCNRQWSGDITIKVMVGSQSSHSYHYSKCETCGASIAVMQEKRDVIERKCGIVMLTGTPIKNRADEYFVPLNLIAPTKFQSLDRFRRNWLIQDDKGKWSRVHPSRLEAFKTEIAPYVLRREKQDVYDETPALNRMYTVITIEDEHLKKLYNQELDKIDLKMVSGKSSYNDLQSNLMWLRRICGMAKVKWASEYVDLTLEDSDNDKTKVVIGMHHQDVREALLREIGAWRCETFDGSDSAESKYDKQVKFEHNEKRVLIINMLAGGVGCDFHYLDTILVLERQWNSQDEDQFEYRFYNPDKSIKDRPTNIEYVIAQGTIDSWWYNHVQRTREIFGETVSTIDMSKMDPGSFRDLMEQTVANRL